MSALPDPVLCRPVPPLPRKRHVLISRWQVAAAPAAVWDLLSRIEDWPRWWPHLHAVQVRHRPPQGGAGLRADLHWRGPLRYGLRLHLLTTRAVRGAQGHCEIEGRASGDLQGRGLWLLSPVAGGGTEVIYRWEVELHRPWMRRLAPLLRGAFEWNHFCVMRAGAHGMARELGCAPPDVADWSGGPA